MDISAIIFRTVLVYCIILLVLRFMGKREIGQLSVLDFVVSIMIAELAVISIDDEQSSMLHSIIPLLVLVMIQILFAYLSLKSERFRKLIDGKPTVLINAGKIDEHEMRKQRYNFDDLLIQLRQNKVSKLSDVEFAILEPSGKLSVIEKDKKKSKSKKKPQLPLPIILDGKIQEDHLEEIGKTSLWVRQQMRKLGYRDIKKISYCSIKDDQTFFIDLKDEK
ncbi:membrane protein [Alkalihalobacillus alcalophilus ATCC 27647 = CGMCC 1.3604]|uniref:Membrane protein n=1 Tax=Alkalihalobacillus alcalophilus ATCC 27647 = CGMCC 1.3604 TaxID=1218173 RepID=A0A094WKM1_ALKAL|nr:DUF421 domain-containing protein [Alkalihalobacillus alcalophilus]KGA96508.1 membrane protein [Alkalihalobacillus alcalophilus ATCC 27647 = CGMCC 1.3604]MED1561564.1 DUF421 domain-containing protein [Alkalihalobacillus alcalophilus]THG90547.1 membrane protein [Alkalihalobacillus alcalophilus ATCC 27647 = CGMCC 1.3604]